MKCDFLPTVLCIWASETYLKLAYNFVQAILYKFQV